jgi:shikimate kinase
MSEAAALPANLSRIVLTGFMGAGKTTVGALLARRLGWDFVDSDRVVESRAGTTIAEIFVREGEPAFREKEAAAIRDIATGQHLVIGLGGGALEMASTRNLLATLSETFIVFLDAPLETLLARCARHEDGPVRPVLADRQRLYERWNLRLPWYARAHLTVGTGDLQPEEVADWILRRLQAEPSGREARSGVRV